jgi:hypothetical protein
MIFLNLWGYTLTQAFTSMSESVLVNYPLYHVAGHFQLCEDYSGRQALWRNLQDLGW